MSNVLQNVHCFLLDRVSATLHDKLHAFIYKLDFMNGFKYMLNDLLTSSWFIGDFLAASNNLS